MDNIRPIRVMLVEDHTVVRQALVYLIQKYSDLELVAQAADGIEAVRFYSQHQPDVVLMDLDLPVMDGFQATREIISRYPQARIVALSALIGNTYAGMAHNAGALRYLDKTISPDTLVEVIRNVYDERALESQP
ncbi:MAG: response regulator transcription factor [Chloroflexi bacterium]|nr:response regulator transcription factor [Chloroflexota bacterium]MCI0577091.1 response regulator transcription factor [Chloroflexota bacterium]MCI0647652.1 response regulator transcription factor [Chloroflexota bacterium]MCI0730082.1 response regulator transcription factor [Chloroflexota bacterium]